MSKKEEMIADNADMRGSRRFNTIDRTYSFID